MLVPKNSHDLGLSQSGGRVMLTAKPPMRAASRTNSTMGTVHGSLAANDPEGLYAPFQLPELLAYPTLNTSPLSERRRFVYVNESSSPYVA